MQIYKSFILPNLDYCDIICHQPTYSDFTREYTPERAFSDPVNINEQFTNNIEAVQYNSALAITGHIHRTSRENLHSELA